MVQPIVDRCVFSGVSYARDRDGGGMSDANDGLVHNPEFLVETEWLARHLDDPGLVVLDCTAHLIPDPKTAYTVKSGRQDFENRHVPGAQFVDLQADLSDNSGC